MLTVVKTVLCRDLSFDFQLLVLLQIIFNKQPEKNEKKKSEKESYQPNEMLLKLASAVV